MDIDVALRVLDWIVRGAGSLVLLAALLFLIVLVWDLVQVEREIPLQPESERVATVTPIRPKIVEIYQHMGLKARFDYADFGGGISDRLGHCYMLAGKAALRSGRYPSLPEPVAIIHGSMHGPDAAERIGHAIVLLDDGSVWEPVTQGIYDRTMFESYSRWQRHHIHSISEARHWMNETGTYGPWISVL